MSILDAVHAPPHRTHRLRSGDVRSLIVGAPLALSPLVVAGLSGLMTPTTPAQLAVLVGAAFGSLVLALVLGSVHLGLVGANAGRDRAEAATRVDVSTGLLDGSALRLHLERWNAVGQQDGTGLALLCIDLGELRDRIRRVGIVGGDKRIAQLGGRLRRLVRRTHDEVFLLDDERVVVVLSEIEPEVAHAVAWRLVDHMRAEGARLGTAAGLQASIGVAFRRTGDSAGAWLTRAIHAMELARVTRGGVRDGDPSVESLAMSA